MSTQSFPGEETMVGFENEAMILKERLARGPKKLETISIVGMGGLGKTTIAREVYDDPPVVYHFYVRVWISVSQKYQNKDLLVRLLSSVIQRNPIDFTEMSECKLAELLRKSLKGRVYFIVMDDIWDIRAWDDLKSCFPDDNNGSRVMFTSRHESVSLLAKSNSPPLFLRFLTDDESWDLFQQKVFRRETCPPQLIELGKEITRKCQGLPLAIVVVAGILANEQKSQDRWKHVVETMNSSLASDSQLCEKILSLSYDHLPPHLKHCFLYFGVFPEDSHIPVRKLIWLWVAEGFVRNSTGHQSLEDVAGGYLSDLIGRSLILVSKKGYDSGVKTCGIHDLLRGFCIEQAEKELSLQQISTQQPQFRFPTFLHPNHICIKDSKNAWTATSVCAFFGKKLGTSFIFNSQRTGSQIPDFVCSCYHLLRVLDVTCFRFYWDISDMVNLVHLRYLEFDTSDDFQEICPPASISNLQNLETFIIHGQSPVILPQCIRKIVKLRHVLLTAKRMHKIEGQDPDARYPFSLDDLQTLSWVDPWSSEDFIAGTLNLKSWDLWGLL